MKRFGIRAIVLAIGAVTLFGSAMLSNGVMHKNHIVIRIENRMINGTRTT
nr:hypothetical protein [Paenibacillus montanisoli]